MPSRPAGTPKPDPKGGAPKAAAPRAGSPKAVPSKAGSPKADAPKVDSSKADSGKADSNKAAAEVGSPAPAAPAGPRKYPKGGPAKPDLKRYRAMLEAMLTGNLKSSKGLEKEALKSSGQDFSVDHMADHGTDNFDQDFTLGLLEGKTELVREIQDAIAKIDGKGELPFGVCEACADRPEEKWARGCETCPWIPKGRLDVMPHARMCIKRQEELEDDS